jgi:hypothetical protein
MTTVRSSRASNRVAYLLGLTIAIVVSVGVSAHRRDEYLQAARLAIEPAAVQIELDLTPGIAVAEAIIADIDRDRDGLLSSDEQRTYGRLVFSALELAVDGRPLPVELGVFSFPDPEAMRRGEGTIRLRSAATLQPLSVGAHQLLFRNRHHPDRSVYLANALVPESDRVAVTAQRRDGDQRELIISYRLGAAPATSQAVWLLSSLAAATVLAMLLMGPRRSVRVKARRPVIGELEGS